MQTQVHVSTQAYLTYCKHPRMLLDQTDILNRAKDKLSGKPAGVQLWTSSLNTDISEWVYWCRTDCPRRLHIAKLEYKPLAEYWLIDVKPTVKIFDLDSPTKVKRFVHFFGSRPLSNVRSYIEIDWNRVRAQYDGVRFSNDYDIDTDDDLRWLQTWTTESTVWFNPKVLYNYRKRSLARALRGKAINYAISA